MAGFRFAQAWIVLLAGEGVEGQQGLVGLVDAEVHARDLGPLDFPAHAPELGEEVGIGVARSPG